MPLHTGILNYTNCQMHLYKDEFVDFDPQLSQSMVIGEKIIIKIFGVKIEQINFQ